MALNAATPFVSAPRRSPCSMRTVGDVADEAGSVGEDIRIETMAAKLALNIRRDYGLIPGLAKQL